VAEHRARPVGRIDHESPDCLRPEFRVLALHDSAETRGVRRCGTGFAEVFEWRLRIFPRRCEEPNFWEAVTNAIRRVDTKVSRFHDNVDFDWPSIVPCGGGCAGGQVPINCERYPSVSRGVSYSRKFRHSADSQRIPSLSRRLNLAQVV